MSTDIDSLLTGVAKASARDQEVSRILGQHAEDFFAILDINPLENPDSIDAKVTKIYRQKSLLIHPDRTDNKDAPAAFDRLKKAQLILSDVDKKSERERLLQIYQYVGEKGIDEVRKQVSEVLDTESRHHKLEDDLKKQQEALTQEEQQKKREEIRLKKELADKWEDKRESRVSNWRNFAKKVEKKKKPKKRVLA